MIQLFREVQKEVLDFRVLSYGFFQRIVDGLINKEKGRRVLLKDFGMIQRKKVNRIIVNLKVR